MSEIAPVDAASCRAMAVECGRLANKLLAFGKPAAARAQIERARHLTILALKFDQESNPPSDGDAISEVKGIARPENAVGVESSLSGPHSTVQPDPQLPVGSNGGPGIPNPEAGGAKMDGSQASPDRAAPAEFHLVNSGQAVPHSRADAGADITMEHLDIRI